MKTLCKLVAAVLIMLAYSASSLGAQSPAADLRATGLDPAQFPQVRAFVSITDAQGRPIQTLPKENFRIQEDGRDAEIVAINTSNDPIFVGLVIDHSGSMQGSKLPDAQAAAVAFIEQLRAQDQAFVMQFDDATEALTNFTSDRAVLKRAVDSIQIRGGTAFYDAVFAGVEKFQARAEVRKKAVIVLTDGQDNREDPLQNLLGRGSRHTLDETITAAKQANVTVYAIGLGGDADRDRLNRLARETKGRAYFSPGGQELRDLYLLIAEQLQKEYAIDFKSPRPAQDGTRRNVQISVTLPDGTTETATGVYVAGYLFNRIRANWLLAALLGLVLFGMALAPATVRLLAAGPKSDPTSVEPLPPQTGTRACPNCGAAVRPNARFCGNCRYDLVAPPRAAQQAMCPNCGNVVRAGAKFCGRCRNPL